MKKAANFTEIKARKMYYTEQNGFERALDSSRTLMFYQWMFFGTITWQTLYYLNATIVV